MKKVKKREIRILIVGILLAFLLNFSIQSYFNFLDIIDPNNAGRWLTYSAVGGFITILMGIVLWKHGIISD